MRVYFFEIIFRLAKAIKSFSALFGSFGFYMNIANYFVDLVNIYSKCGITSEAVGLNVLLGFITILQIFLVNILFFTLPGIGLLMSIFIYNILNLLILKLVERAKNELLAGC